MHHGPVPSSLEQLPPRIQILQFIPRCFTEVIISVEKIGKHWYETMFAIIYCLCHSLYLTLYSHLDSI